MSLPEGPSSFGWAEHATAITEATEAQKDQGLEAIERALCPEENHPDHCPVSWTTLACRFEDLDPLDRAAWQESFNDDRRRARDEGLDGV